MLQRPNLWDAPATLSRGIPLIPHHDATGEKPSSTWIGSAPPGIEMARAGRLRHFSPDEKGWAVLGKAHTFECAGCRPQISDGHGDPARASCRSPSGSGANGDPLPGSRNSSVSATDRCRWRGATRRAWWKSPAVHSGPKTNSARCSSSRQEAACGWPKSPPTPPTSDTSSKPPPIPTPSRKPTVVRLRCGPADRHNVHVVGKTAAHLVLPWIHQVFSNLKGWAEASTTGCVQASAGLSR